MDQSLDATPPGMSLQDFLLIMRRRRTVVLQAFVIVSAVGVAVTLMSQSVYQAKSRLLVQATSAKLSTVDASNPISALLAITDPQTAATQVEVLQSPSLLKRVSKEAGVDLNGIHVTQVEDTNVIEVTAESFDPARAASAANTLLADYLQEDVGRNLAQVHAAQAFAVEHGADAAKQLDQTQSELAKYKEKFRVSDLTEERQQQIQHVASLQSSFEQQSEALGAIRKQLAAERQLLAQQPSGVVSHSDITNPVIQVVKDKIADLTVQRQALLQPGQYTRTAPEVQSLDAQIASLQHRLEGLPRLTRTDIVSPNPDIQTIKTKIIDLSAQSDALSTQVSKLNTDLNNARNHIGNFAQWEVALDRLTLKRNQAADQYKMFQDKVADLSLREKSEHPSATIIEAATTPDTPIRPKRLLNIILGCLLGLFAGVSLALLQEFLDDRINSTQEADQILGLPSLGFVPALTTSDAKLLSLMKDMDPAAESYRILRTNIHFASIDNPLRTLLVTSPGPGEGKTTTATNLAFAMALDGKKVILVDTDLRRPALNKLLQLPPTPGLTDVLLDHIGLDEALQSIDHLSNLKVLIAGSVPPNPGELLNSRRFRTLIDELKERADIVIFDSPPALVAADAAILASEVDGTMLVIEVGSTKKGGAQRAVTVLQQARANILGVAYNKIHDLSGGYYYSHYAYKYTAPSLTDSSNASDKRKLLESGVSENGSEVKK